MYEYSHNQPCNFRNATTCPLSGNWRSTSIIYKETVRSENQERQYYGLCKGKFKSRFNNHTYTFNHPEHRKRTELSKYVWELKDKNTAFSIDWNITSHARPYQCGSKRCDLCTTEKLIIALADRNKSLNKRAELISKCRHENKFYLSNYK